MAGERDLTDAQWALIELLLPSTKGRRSRPFRDHRPLIDGIVYRFRTGCPWRDVPERYGPWRAVWRRHSQSSSRGVWDQVLLRLLAQADAAGQVRWDVSADSTTARVHQHAATLSRDVAVSLPSHTGAGSNYKDLPSEPIDHAIGRSRGGLTTKLYALVDGRGRPLVIDAGPGHANDSPMLPVLLAALQIPRLGPGRARTRPDALLADKAYSSRSHRALLRPRYQSRHPRTRRPDRPPPAQGQPRRTTDRLRPRPLQEPQTSSNAASTTSSNGEASPAATTSSPSTTAAAPSCEQS